MPRKFSTKRMVLLLVMAALILGGGASWLTSGPREPVLHGKPLSWWFSEGLKDQSAPTPRRLTAEELRGLGPEALAWLSHKAAQTSIWEEEYSASPKNMRVRLYWWMRGRWFDRLASRTEQVRFKAVVALRTIGPDAAPAIPSLLKAAGNLNSDTRLVAAHTLLEMGSVSWPAVADAMRHGKRRTQEILLYQMDLRWTPNTQPAISPQKFTEIVEFLIPLTVDPDQWLRELARTKLDDCLEGWNSQPQNAEGVRLAAGSLTRRFEGEPNELLRIQILGTLALLEPNNPLWPAKLYELAASPSKALAEAAERALIHAGK